MAQPRAETPLGGSAAPHATSDPPLLEQARRPSVDLAGQAHILAYYDPGTHDDHRHLPSIHASGTESISDTRLPLPRRCRRESSGRLHVILLLAPCLTATLPRGSGWRSVATVDPRSLVPVFGPRARDAGHLHVRSLWGVNRPPLRSLAASPAACDRSRYAQYPFRMVQRRRSSYRNHQVAPAVVHLLVVRPVGRLRQSSVQNLRAPAAAASSPQSQGLELQRHTEFASGSSISTSPATAGRDQ